MLAHPEVPEKLLSATIFTILRILLEQFVP